VRYVLGDLSEEEEIRVGKRYLSEEAEVEEFALAEDEVVDRYVRGELSPKDSRRFDQILRNSARLKERVEFARLLARKVSLESRVSSESALNTVGEPTSVPKPRKTKGSGFLSFEGFWGTATVMSPTVRFALAASVVLMLVASLGVVVLWTRLQAESQRLASEQQERQRREKEIQGEKARTESLQAELEQARRENELNRTALAELEQRQQEQGAQQVQTPSFPVIFLTPWTGSRGGKGGSERSLEVHGTAIAVVIKLDVRRGDYPSYNASITDANDRVVSEPKGLTPVPRRSGPYIRLQVARNAIADGLYNVHVDGVTASGQVENFADYPFRVRIR
jgi:hypothetical protein